ncbi:hypothetical protein ACIRYZ_39045 [Kitasatospora sp. NPDC101155]|uniref:hypothetical protein n=1 Tax=Kitasatospora sp. NPDC101155 TaxID=3364097 RepID=UPI0038250CF4
MHDIITLADDPDLAHLVDLIDMLPDPDETSFWGQDSSSISGKIGHRLRAVLNGRAYAKDVDYLAVYVLKYLGRGNGHITEEQITKNLTGVGQVPAAGYAWVEDATRTAWTLVNRYSLPNWRGSRTAPGKAWLEG